MFFLSISNGSSHIIKKAYKIKTCNCCPRIPNNPNEKCTREDNTHTNTHTNTNNKHNQSSRQYTHIYYLRTKSPTNKTYGKWSLKKSSCGRTIMEMFFMSSIIICL